MYEKNKKLHREPVIENGKPSRHARIGQGEESTDMNST